MQRFFSTFTHSRTLCQLGSIACAALLLVACGSGGGGGGGGGNPPAATPSSGVIIDSEVGGLGWKATPSGLSGKTDATGHFQYRQGDKVQFHLDGRNVGSPVDGAAKVTVHSLFGATTLLDSRVVRCSRLLLTLGGGAPVNGVIQLPPTIPAILAPVLDFTPGNVNFDTTVLPGTTLVSDVVATTHLTTSFSTVSVTLAGAGSGTVASNPTGISCGTTCSNVFINGDSVTLTATGSGFAGWSAGTGSATVCNGLTGASCIFTPTSDSSITATFNVPPPPTLTTSIIGNGTVACSTGGTFGPCVATYASGTALVLQATANSGSTFTGWTNGTGNATVCNNTSVNCSMPLNADSAVTANFVLNTVTFSLSTSPLSANGGVGTIACSISGIGGPFVACAASYNAGTNLTLQATPDIVSNFTGWSSSPNVCSGTGTCQFMLTANTSITANFNHPTLSVVVMGTGTVTSTNIAGINCGATCTAFFAKGTSITLAATGTGFSSWSGCTPVSGTPTQCTVTVTVDTNVTATFGTVSAAQAFKFIGAVGRQLLAINPASPGSPTAVKDGLGVTVTLPSFTNSSGEDGGHLILSGSYDGVSSSFTNLQPTTLIFTNGGKIYKASALVSSGVPGAAGNIPVRVSSLTTAKPCGLGTLLDPTNPNPVIGYGDPGADGDCNTENDNFITVMHLNDLSATAAVALPVGTRVHEGSGGAFDLATGHLLHTILVTGAGDLQWMDTNLSPTNITFGAGIGKVRIVGRQTDKMFLMSNTALYLYTPSTHTVTLPPVVTASAGTTLFDVNSVGDPRIDGTTDANNMYVLQTDGAVYKVPLTTTGGTITTKFFTLPAGSPFVRAYQTTNSIIIETGTNPIVNNGQAPCALTNPPTCNNGIIAVSKTTGAFTTIEANVPANAIYMAHPFGDQVLYTLNDGTANGGAKRQSETGGGASSLGSNWSGAVQASSINLVTSMQSMTSATIETCTNNCVVPPTGTVQVITSPTQVTPVTLGTVGNSPALQFLPFFNQSSNTALIGFGQLQGSTNTQPFFVDTTVSNSVAPVPTPPPATQWKELSSGGE
jgi:hypothetical protein